MEHSLTKFGFNPQTEANKLQQLSQKEQINYLTRELESHELHVVRDHVVSLPYYYWLSEEGNIFTNKDKTNELELDERERGGYFKLGIPKALKLAEEHPQQLVLLYSPIGPASFDHPVQPDYAKPYKIGQLYLIYSDGKKINNISVSLDEQGEKKWLREIFSEDYLKMINSAEDQIEKIKKFIINPQLTEKTIDDFLNHGWSDSNLVIFHNNGFGNEKVFSVADVISELKKSLTGQLHSQINIELIASQALKNGGAQISSANIDWAYRTMISVVMKQAGVNEITLGGGCGGSVVKSSDLFNVTNSVDKLMNISNFSSSFRQQLSTTVNSSENSDRYDDYQCPKCHQVIKGELKEHPETWHTECPHCHHQLSCKSD